METYFEAVGVEDDCNHAGTISMYLTNVALLWRRRRCDNCYGQPIRAREEFKEAFHEQFYPKHEENEARARLHCLDHMGEL